mgnify:CR=1 FL=1|jgi:hypothetical protein
MSKTINEQSQELKQAYQDVFNCPQGQLVMRDLVIQSGYGSSLVEKDPHMTYYNEGKRDLFLHILSQIGE